MFSSSLSAREIESNLACRKELSKMVLLRGGSYVRGFNRTVDEQEAASSYHWVTSVILTDTGA
jgi:hypothetical protein